MRITLEYDLLSDTNDSKKVLENNILIYFLLQYYIRKIIMHVNNYDFIFKTNARLKYVILVALFA